jgi:hypothetical protein
MGCTYSEQISDANELDNDTPPKKKISSQQERLCQQFRMSETHYQNIVNQYNETDILGFVRSGGNLDEDLHTVIHNILNWKKNEPMSNDLITITSVTQTESNKA